MTTTMRLPASRTSRSSTQATVQDLDTVLGSIAPVYLDELLNRAALQTRTDRKYVLAMDATIGLLEDLRERAQILEIAGSHTFGYESVYFDTPALRSFMLAARRRPARFKIRTRTYLDSGECWLEIKTRDRRGRTVKARQPHDLADRRRVTPAGHEFVRAVLDEQRLSSEEAATLRPTLVTRYSRATLLVPGATPATDSRLTIDTGLVCSRDDSAVVRLPSRAVVETKSGAGASAVDRLLWSRGQRPSQISKYGTGLVALDPRLPSAKWMRVLHRNPFEHTVLPAHGEPVLPRAGATFRPLSPEARS
ncbi:polyphosphate polymerase domain-containing protein [Sanguibacter antarcticus]|uniref:VTC domain-containing protein n=1 Tax=Sanguibacter antarcticus TaxID=372484 RepID=A0A2A9E887_9MICO|nr:polyphosphate polymerase domain-containing protein [Sanguibacter antarcticus]PFG35168.1 VTC domain-containing protein [Sanguibacter antarcticus]